MNLLSDIDVSGKRVFVRADLDVPISPTANSLQLIAESGKQSAEIATRLTNLKPTIEYILAHGAKKIIIAGHIDRPSFTKVTEGKPPNYNPALSTEQLLEPLEKILGTEILFAGNELDLPKGTGKVFLLENLRFWPGEEANDPEFAMQLASLADVYISEAFGNCHRNHASMVSLPSLLPHAAGLHLEKEVGELTKLIGNPQRPFVAIVGGAKLETKIPVVENLAKIADHVLVGGAIAREMANSKQLTVNGSEQYAVSGEHIMVASLTPDTKDIDEESIGKFKEVISGAKTIVWNGPMGLFEEGHEVGTMAIAKAIIDSGAYSVVGGGDTTQFLAAKNLLSPPAGGFSFVSAGGGAMLEFLSGKELPGIKALE